jgi:regulator of sigma E protease
MAIGTFDEVEQMIVLDGRVEVIHREFAKDTGLLPDDEIRSINDMAVEPEAVEQVVMEHPSSRLTLGIHRPPKRLLKLFTLRAEKDFSAEVETRQRAVIGVPLSGPDVPMPTRHVRYNIIEAIPRGIADGWSTFVTSVKSVWLIMTRRVSTKAIGGPLFINQLIQEAAREGIDWLVKLVGLISIYLSIFNLLPIPVLDGGHVAFLAVEGVRKKPIDDKYQEALQYAGVVLFIIFFLFITYNDIMRRIGGPYLR